MKKYQGIFIDSSIPSEISKYYAMGFIRGVTTNPTILSKDGLKGGFGAIKNRIKEISELVKPYPVSVELLTNDPKEMFSQALELHAINPNVVIKVTIHGPNGELDNLKIIKDLEANSIPVNATAMMNAQQCLLAAMSGASYISLFCGRINNIGYDSKAELKKIRLLIDKFNLDAKIIACSLREIINISDWFISGADIVTIPPVFYKQLIVHPYSKETIQMFLKDASSLLKK